MNAGIYGMTNGQGMAGRKVAGRIGMGTSASTGGNLESISSLGIASNALTLTSGVRTRVVSVTGKGALRWFGHVSGPTGAPTVKYEIVADGVTALNISVTATGSIGYSYWGHVTNTTISSTAKTTPVFDFLPFDQSLEIYITEATSMGAGSYGYVVDMHQ
jgi:hypothetical protein